MQVGRTNRRAFIAGLVGAAAWPLTARAQQTRSVYRVGFLAIARDLPRTWQALIEGLRDHGYVIGGPGGTWSLDDLVGAGEEGAEARKNHAPE